MLYLGKYAFFKMSSFPAADALQPVPNSRSHNMSGPDRAGALGQTGHPIDARFTVTAQLPGDEEDVVAQLYPPLAFSAGSHWVEVRHDRIHSSKWKQPVYFRDVTECGVKKKPFFFTPVLSLTLQGSVTRLRLNSFRGPKGSLEEAFMSYYGSHVARLAYSR